MSNSEIKKIVKAVFDEYIKKEKELLKLATQKKLEEEKQKEEKKQKERLLKEQERYKKSMTFKKFLSEFDLSETLQEWGDEQFFQTCFPDKYEIINKKYTQLINELRDLF